jgi:hypothetical protein
VVEESRQPPKHTLRLLGSTAGRKRDGANTSLKIISTRSLSHTLWTEEEFVGTWKSVAGAIERGKAGLDTWIVKDSADGTLWRIRLFTWGEIVAHSWLLLFILSNKLTGSIAMEWIAADGEVVVQMSPGTNLEGVWERKGPEGAKGVWTFTHEAGSNSGFSGDV